jgi:dihydroorotase
VSTIYDTIIRSGHIVTETGVLPADIAIQGELIVGIGSFSGASAQKVIDATGLHVLPGVIDLQVHFREPGHLHKEDMLSGSRAAILGGVTCVLESGNTDPPTTTLQRLSDKIALAEGRLYCDAMFAFAATKDNIQILAEAESIPGCCGIELFMATTTGGVVVDDDGSIERVLRATRRRVFVHAADEARISARREIAIASGDVRSHPIWRDPECSRLGLARVAAIARRLHHPIHIMGVSSHEELQIVSEDRDLVTADVTVNHLIFAAEDIYDRVGVLAHMNPPIRDRTHRAALWSALLSGTIDAIGTDHAPHTVEEKLVPYPNGPYPNGAAGIPGVQTALPAMLNQVNYGRLTLPRLVEIMAKRPAEIMGLSNKGEIRIGKDADLVLVDLNLEQQITREWLASRSGWSPFERMTIKGWPIMTLLRGNVVADHGHVVGDPVGTVVGIHQSKVGHTLNSRDATQSYEATS